MAISLSSTFTNTLLGHGTGAGAAIADQIGGGTLVVYSGTAPDGANEALGQHATNTALLTFTFSAAASQGTPSTGSMSLSFTSTTATASASGTATFFRVLSSSSAVLFQGTVGTSGADATITNTSVASGDSISISGTPSISFPVA